MPLLQEGDSPDTYQKKTQCLVCDRVLKYACVREVRIELELADGGRAPEVYLDHYFCSPACAKTMGRIVAEEINHPDMEDLSFPGHVCFRGQVSGHQVHFTKVGPASYDTPVTP